MSSTTYQTLTPSELTEFCEAMAPLFAQVERDLYKALLRGENLNELKRNYQKKSGINARQFNSIKASVIGKIKGRKECYERQIAELKFKDKRTGKIHQTESQEAESCLSKLRHQWKSQSQRSASFRATPQTS